VVNDTAKYLQIVNDNTFNYADTSQSGTGLGVGFGLKSGVLLARYFVKGMKLVSDVNINISSENTVGKNFVAVVLDSKHNLIGTSDVYKVNESDVNKYVNFKIIYPPFINNSDIYVGLAQGEDTIPVYPLNAQYENPGRWSAFYSCDIRLNNFAQQNTFNRWMIEAVLKEPNDYDLSLVDITEPETSCSLGQSEKVSVKIINQGYKQVANTPIGILINNVFTRDTIFKTINPGDTISYTFNHTFDFSKEGDYNVKVFSILSSDQNHANDTISSMLTHVAYAKLPYSLGFEPSENTDGWSVYDENGDGYTWGIVKEDALTGSYSVRYSYNYEDTTIAADDWLVSTCFRLFPKNNYKLTFWYKCGDTLYPEKLIVAMGKNPVPSQLTIPLKVIDTIINTEYKRAIISFTVPDDDIYYFGWKAASQPNRWRLMLDSIQIFQDTATYVSTIFNRDSYIIIYPNPANDKFYINSTDKLNCLKVYNNIGELVFCQKPDKKYSEINTSSLKTGIYFINIESLNGIVNRKVSVIH
ncbi:MAG: T9SS type A sorting domain-containing protein, partial [Bacteroidota bacterium]|nr:T9SS type A sorting domain-containing protein [Bacteroidota bacterium]